MFVTRRTLLAVVAAPVVLAAAVPATAVASDRPEPGAPTRPPARASARAADPVLSLGSSGRPVTDVQTFLHRMLPGLRVTGTYDTATRDAVVLYQTWLGIPADGVVGMRTWPKIRARVVLPLRPVLSEGDAGPAVRDLQRALAARDRSLPVDGSFGPRTRKAVEAFQRAQGIRVSGRCDPQTWMRLIPS